VHDAGVGEHVRDVLRNGDLLDRGRLDAAAAAEEREDALAGQLARVGERLRGRVLVVEHLVDDLAAVHAAVGVDLLDPCQRAVDQRLAARCGNTRLRAGRAEGDRGGGDARRGGERRARRDGGQTQEEIPGCWQFAHGDFLSFVVVGAHSRIRAVVIGNA